ncbi:MAG: hypothetical protein K2L67_06830 [Clostridia bacterium]|nr:hypothetical protein [Clostridia bacterium]
MADKQEHKEAENGRLYFTFNRGAEFKFKPPYSREFTHKITACELDEATEAEFYRIESEGDELPTRFSAAQIAFMLAQLPHEQTAEGEPLELPLLADEVKAFYGAKLNELKKANVAENAKLKGTAWNKNLQLSKSLSESLQFYKESGDTAKVKELEAQLAKIEAAQKKLLTDKHVDVLILHKVPACKICNDTGIIEGKICECARKSTAAIKSYCAAKRLANK